MGLPVYWPASSYATARLVVATAALSGFVVDSAGRCCLSYRRLSLHAAVLGRCGSHGSMHMIGVAALMRERWLMPISSYSLLRECL